MASENKTCDICKKEGQERYTAKCSHSFHLGCIQLQLSTSGIYLCPICSASWNNLPSDDDPLPAVTAPTPTAALQNVSLWSVLERDAVAASESMSNFAVLVGLRAPPLSEDARQALRVPIDLVTVLDVSGSMKGPKLDLVQRAVCFVIDNLGPSDRFSMVCFSTGAQRILPLRRMTEIGHFIAKRAVDSLLAVGGTTIVEGLKKGVQVLEERQQKNLAASIMFLSDGLDNLNNMKQYHPNYAHILPASICPKNKGVETKQTIPVHAFGFGTDHDPVLMHAISDSSGSTFSFIETYEMVQDAFATCIGGLLSIVTQELCLSLRSASHGVNINSIPSGSYPSEISDQGSRGKITVGDLYAEEEKEFLIYVSVPVYARGEDEGNQRTSSLLDITCSYKDVFSKERVQIEFAEIRRPGNPLPSDVKVKLEVDRQKNRVNAAEGYAEAARVAETGDLKGACAILSKKRSSLLASDAGQSGDGLLVKLEAEMKETEESMGSRETYERTGRALALSNISAHANQRATTRCRVGEQSSADSYVTPNMANMVNKAQQIVKIEDDIKRKKIRLDN